VLPKRHLISKEQYDKHERTEAVTGNVRNDLPISHTDARKKWQKKVSSTTTCT
jgi:hypothetical protein